MFFFNRHRRADRQFPQLSVKRANELRAALREGFLAHGFELTFDGTIAQVTHQDDGRDLSLNTDDLVHAVEQDDSPKAAEKWAETFVRAVAAVDKTLNLDTSGIYRSVRVILLGDGAGAVDEAESAEVVRGIERSLLRPVAEGLNLCLMLDAGDAVAPADVSRVGEHDDLETLERAALNNLSAELAQLEVAIDYQTDDDNTTGCWLVRSTGPYLAGAPLLMDEFIVRHLPDLDTENGILFALPFPNVLLVREVGTGQELAQALNILAAGAMIIAEHAKARDLISARVYLHHLGLIEAVSTVADDGSYVIDPNSYLLGRLHS